MATTDYPVNHPLAVKVWEKRLMAEALYQTYASRFMGTGSDSVIQVKEELQKSAGDKITIGLRTQLDAPGVAGDGTLEGNEEPLDTQSDSLFIDQLRNAVRSAGKMSEQRVPFSIRAEAKDGLRDWLSDRIDTWFFNQVTGNTAQSDTRYTGMNTVTAPSTTANNTRLLYADGASTTEGSLTASQVFQLTYIDRAVVTAQTATPLIRPIMRDGEPYYVMFLHPWQVYSLRTDATANRITWYDTQKIQVQGGLSAGKSGIFTGALGVYNGVILHQSKRVPASPTNTSARRAVLCGAQAASFALGGSADPDSPNWYEELFDYGNQLGVKAGIIGGLKKNIFNSIDFATVVVASYAVAP